MKSKLLIAIALALAYVLVWANWPETRLPQNSSADRILICKHSRKLTLMRNGHPLKEYRVSLGSHSVGAKQREGDRKTPEGIYRITEHKQDSAFYRALRLSYPEQRDVERARSMGVRPGSDIMIHGLKNGLGLIGKMHRVTDWTAGCVALTNPEIDEIWRAVPDGTPVEIVP